MMKFLKKPSTSVTASESYGETLVYELASESNESFIQSSDTVLRATSGESAMIQMSEPNKELESETMCDSEFQVQGVHLRESFKDLDPGNTEYRSIIENVTDPAEARKLLRDNFRPDNRSHHMQLFSEFFQCRLQQNEKINIFSTRIKRISDQLEAISKPMDDTYQCYQLLRSLHSKFDSIVQNILRWNDDTFKCKDVLLELVAKETRINFRDSLNLQRSQHEMFSVQKSRIKCHYCGKFGHFKRECRYGSTAASSGVSNRRYRECRTPSPKLRRHPVVPFFVGSSISSDKCHYDFRGGRQDRGYPFKDRNDLSKYHDSTNFVTHQNECKSKLSFFLAEANLSCNVSKDAWIVDTAASNHFTNNKDLFINFEDVVNKNMVLAVNSVEFPIKGKGDVKIWFNGHECLL
ncbi:retrovirus-related Pol polyprotein from transposon TNT 1-94 [Trichonephila clavata]|uniref:Retrovirus-related Pol polyprotein from transposon TNT 1-94 n=1 Tax=Trichonephila clavata TaxID=2740835 RepID=A0A8X6EWD3_TRICU|nr:retrovirus-related Pol polyprotein from transposon TNT 1-94 [Trichonephila clavata]